MHTGIISQLGDAFGEALNRHGWARAPIDAEGLDVFMASAPDHTWRFVEGIGYAFETAVVDPGTVAEAMGVFSAAIVRHRAGHFGLPPFAGGGEGELGFVLDFNEEWASQDGGLLLFQDGDRLSGWRPEQGVITAFVAARPPILTLLTPAAGDRYAIIGRLA